MSAEFANDVDRVDAVEPAKNSYFPLIAELRRAIEGEGIPYTYIGFAGLFVSKLGQRGLRVPPRDKVEILGNGNAKGLYIYKTLLLMILCSEYNIQIFLHY